MQRLAKITALTMVIAVSAAVEQTGGGRTVLDGPRVQGGLLVGHTVPGTVVLLERERLNVSEHGDFLVGFDRDAPAELQLELRYPDGERQTRRLEIAPRQYRIQRIDGLPPAQVTPPPDVRERIREEARQVRAARSRDDDRLDFLGGFSWPASGPISGVYGSQRILNGKPRRPHYGVDVAAPEGAPVTAPAAGLVTLAHADMYFSGGTVVIDHGHRLSSTFLHLSEVLVEIGQRVEQGQLIARVGATGRVTGAHLDWRMNWADARIDPQLLVPPLPPERD